MIMLKELKELRDYLESGEWAKRGSFHMWNFWMHKTSWYNGLKLGRDDFYTELPCGCVMGHAHKKFKGVIELNDNEEYVSAAYGLDCVSSLFEFLFSASWHSYDNTVEGAIGRIDAVLDGLRM